MTFRATEYLPEDVEATAIERTRERNEDLHRAMYGQHIRDLTPEEVEESQQEEGI